MPAPTLLSLLLRRGRSVDGYRCLALNGCLWLGLAMPLAPFSAPSRAWAETSSGVVVDAASETDVEAAIARLIEQLGSPDYATRVRAREELLRIGLPAIDALQPAQYHADSQIAFAARSLIDTLMGHWWTEHDLGEVRKLLTNYGNQSDAEKRSRIDRIAEQTPHASWRALARLARYEPSETLSQHAAMMLLRSNSSQDAIDHESLGKMIASIVGSSKRVGAQWLAAYAVDLQSKSVVPENWQALIEAQRQAARSADDRERLGVTHLELIRLGVQRATDAGQTTVAEAMIRNHLDLIPPRSRDLLTAVGWIVDSGQYPLVLELHRRHPRVFAEQPVLLYGAAEATLRGNAAGGEQAADALAAAALAIDPLPDRSTGESTLSPRAIDDVALRHSEIGRELEARGLFRWAEQEYQQVIQALPDDSVVAAYTRVRLSSLLGEQDRHQDIVSTLEPLIHRAEADEAFATRLQSKQLDVTQLKSTLLFHQGQLARLSEKSTNSDVVKQAFSAAWQLDPANIDILIAMYHYDGDVYWRTEVRNKVRQATQQLERKIEDSRRLAFSQSRYPDLDQKLSQAFNQYAWLVANTEGDQNKALNYSLESLQLSAREAANWDTCARCHFALGDYDEAIRTQQQALKLMPHSPPLKRQLEEFLAAKAKANSAVEPKIPARIN